MTTLRIVEILWFVLAFVLLVVALVLLRLDSTSRRAGGVQVDEPRAVDPGTAGDPGAVVDDTVVDDTVVDARLPGDGDAPAPVPVAGPGSPSTPRPAPFQRDPTTAGPRPREEAGQVRPGGTATPQAAPVPDGSDVGPLGSTPAVDHGRVGSDEDGAGSERTGGLTGERHADSPDDIEGGPVPAGTTGDGEGEPGGSRAVDAATPRRGLFSRVRGLIPGPGREDAAAGVTGQGGPDTSDDAPVSDTAAASRAVGWLEARGFEPVADEEPELVHGEFATGLPPLGPMSRGIFRGREVRMGVTGEVTVFVLDRPAASDRVVELWRTGLRPAGVSADGVAGRALHGDGVAHLRRLAAERTDTAAALLPGSARVAWVEGARAVATVDGRDHVETWDDTILALHELAAAAAVLPPSGGRARPIPSDIDPGAPGAAAGPEVPPDTGQGRPDQPSGPQDPGTGPTPPVDDTPATARTTPTAVATDGALDEPAESPARRGLGGAVAGLGAAGLGALRRRGHLRPVPDPGTGVRDLGDVPVRPDPGEGGTETPVPGDRADTAAGDGGDRTARPGAHHGPGEEPSPFDAIMGPTGPVPGRGDVAADHLEPRPPLPRPNRSSSATFGDSGLPALADRAGGRDPIKSLGSGDDTRADAPDEIPEDRGVGEVDPTGEHDVATGSQPPDHTPRHGAGEGRHAARSAGDGDATPEWLRDVLNSPRPTGGRRHRAEPDDGRTGSTGHDGREGSGLRRPTDPRDNP